MSANSHLILAGYEAWNRDDLDAYLATLHPEVKFHSSGVWPDLDPVYSGHDGFAEFWRRIHEPWEAFRIDIEQIDERGGCFTARVRLRARGVDSGLEIDMHMAHSFRLRDGLVAEIFSRRTFEEAREALGASEPTAQSQY